MPTLKEVVMNIKKRMALGLSAEPAHGLPLRRRASISGALPIARAATPEVRRNLPLDQLFAMCPDRLSEVPGLDEMWEFLELVDGYLVTDRPQYLAWQLLKNVLRSGGSQHVFPHLHRTVVVYQLGLRVLQPTRIDQGRFGLCGPAALAVETARSRPAEYVRFAATIISSGRGTIGGYAVNPSSSVRNYAITRNSIPEADFLVLASLRDSNQVLDSKTDLGTYHGVSLDGMFDWCVKCGYPSVEMVMAPPK